MDNTLTKPEENAVATAAARPSRVVKPRVDIIDNADAILLVADMAGVSAETLEITLERNTLTLHGTAPTTNKLFQRAFTLSKRIDRDNIEANMKDGVLSLTLNKVAELVPEKRQIAIKAG